jgi:hypothetical protein
MEHFICQVIEVEPAHSLEPCIKIIVPWSIYARFGDLVLGSCIESSMELEHNSDGICVPREVDEVLELIYVCLDILPV